MYEVTSNYLAREGFRSSQHLGIDFAFPNNTPLRSIQEGIVTKIVNYGDVNIGKGVLVKWEDGRTAVYGHMSKITVHKGERVEVGDLLGYSGNTGNVYGENGGYHLHFGLKNADGVFVDPSAFIKPVQYMNDPEKLQLLAGQVTEHMRYSFSDFANEQMNIYDNLFKDFKLQMIDFFSLIDYTVFIQYIQNFL